MTLDFVKEFIERAQDSPSLTFIAISLAIVCLSIMFSGIGAVWVRYSFIALMATLTWQLALDDNPLWQDYYFNISAELIGTIVTAILIGILVFESRLLIPMVFIVVIFSFLPMERLGTDQHPLIVNLSSELLGAFALKILLDRKTSKKSEISKLEERQIARARKEAKKQITELEKDYHNRVHRIVDAHRTQLEDFFKQRKDYLNQRFDRRREAIVDQFNAQYEAWKQKTSTRWDTFVVITGKTPEEIRRKQHAFTRSCDTVEILKPVGVPENGIYDFCFAARIKHTRYLKSTRITQETEQIVAEAVPTEQSKTTVVHSVTSIQTVEHSKTPTPSSANAERVVETKKIVADNARTTQTDTAGSNNEREDQNKVETRPLKTTTSLLQRYGKKKEPEGKDIKRLKQSGVETRPLSTAPFHSTDEQGTVESTDNKAVPQSEIETRSVADYQRKYSSEEDTTEPATTESDRQNLKEKSEPGKPAASRDTSSKKP